MSIQRINKVLTETVERLSEAIKEGTSEHYFIKEILPIIRKQLPRGLKMKSKGKWKLRGRGSIDKKNGMVEFLVDVPNPYGGGGTVAIVLRIGGSYMTDNDNEYFIHVKRPGMGPHESHDRMSGHAKKDALAITKEIIGTLDEYINIYMKR